MIQITDKHDCCGCSACVQSCSCHCITMNEDTEGFVYPEIDKEKCIDCGLCERVCPLIHPAEPIKWKEVLAAKNRNMSERLDSSSGGIFIALARKVIDSGGVVFGAVFDKQWNVVHTYAETLEGVKLMMGSKYVQSDINGTYAVAERFLKDNRTVLFTGTPCQIAGLNSYLRRDYPNLITADFLCHGVPSPGVWQRYLHDSFGGFVYENARPECSEVREWPDAITEITGIEFRDKKTCGWHKFNFLVRGMVKNTGQSVVLQSDIYIDNSFMRGMLSDVYLRPSCYRCKCKNGVSHSDITLADYWGVKTLLPDFADDQGVSLLFVNTAKGRNLLSVLDIEVCQANIKGMELYNGGMNPVLREGKCRSKFFKAYADGKSFAVSLAIALKKPMYAILFVKLRKAVRHILRK